MKITHTFRSGNSCTIDIPEVIAPGTVDMLHTNWDRYPPSRSDRKEWTKYVYPGLIVPLLDEILPATHGPGRMVELMPGVWGWVPKEQLWRFTNVQRKT